MTTEETTCRILVVDDEQSLRIILSQVLTDDGYDVTVAASGEEALELFQQNPFPIVFTDIVMGDLNGLELLQKIKEIQPQTQVIVITSHASLDTAITALRAGAYDYLVKPFSELDMISNVAGRAIEKSGLVEENRRLVGELQNKNEQLVSANKALKELAVRDGLTGLYNHRYFQEALTVEVLRCKRHERIFSVIFIDVDNFKQYNDTNGHPEGDNALKSISDLISSRLRASDILARYGGEEFILLLPEANKDFAAEVGEEIRKLIEQHPFSGEESQPKGKLTISLGVATFKEDGENGSSLLEKADERLYRAKADGRNLLCID
ncbi:MAG: diguanylate cyclase response regulator [Desulfuromonas sp.]|nr:MAG: diguanylate cyclase response regulator [Desulfuromonas sp.]